jgi:uncharacterized protein DUF3187
MGISNSRRINYYLLILLAVVITSREVAASDMGPFNVPPIGLGEMFRETPQFVAPNDHKQGRVQINISSHWLNFWGYHMSSDPKYEWENPPNDFPLKHGNFLVDMEAFSLNHRISVKTSEHLCAEISIPFVFQSGGVWDGFIENFHDTFSISNAGRSNMPRNEVNGYYVTEGGEFVDFSDDIHGVFLGNVIIGGTYLIKSSFPSFGIRALCKLPTSTMKDAFDQNGVDLTFQASTTWNINKFYGHHGFGITFYGSDGLDELKFKRERYSTFSAIEYSCSKTFSIIAQLNTASCVAAYPKLERPVLMGIIGFKKKLGSGTLEFGIIENMFYYDNSPDLGIHIGYTFSK